MTAVGTHLVLEWTSDGGTYYPYNSMKNENRKRQIMGATAKLKVNRMKHFLSEFAPLSMTAKFMEIGNKIITFHPMRVRRALSHLLLWRVTALLPLSTWFQKLGASCLLSLLMYRRETHWGHMKVHFVFNAIHSLKKTWSKLKVGSYFYTSFKRRASSYFFHVIFLLIFVHTGLKQNKTMLAHNFSFNPLP